MAGKLDELLVNLSRYSDRVVNNVHQGVVAVQALVVNEAKATVPKITRNLMKNIVPGVVKIEDGEVSAEIRAQAEYASYVEQGTSRMRAQPYLAPALEMHRNIFIKVLKKAMK